MTVYIVNELMEKKIMLSNLSQVPRIGEAVCVWYKPWPRVVDVLHSVEENSIVVMVE